jgi:YggT family protein
MDVIIVPFLSVLNTIFYIYTWVVIVYIALLWLINFKVMNVTSPAVSMARSFLAAVTEPLLQRIRSVLPNFGGLDLSPLVLILALMFLSNVISRIAFKFN